MAGVKLITQAVVLAGGQGTRLRPLTDNMPKPMVPVGGRPFVEHLIELFKKNGIKEVVFLLGYLPGGVMEHLGDGSDFGIKVKYHVGEVSDETGTRIRNARHLLDNLFLLTYCDNYWPLHLDAMMDFYSKSKAMASTTVYNNKDGGAEYGPENNIHVSDESMVLKYDKERKDPNLNGVDIGFFILDKRALDSAPESNFSFEREILPRLAAENQLAAYRTDHPYYWITTPESLQTAEKFLAPKKIIFLDRDGVINKKMAEGDYVKKLGEFKFLPGVIPALQLLSQNGCTIYVITNQRGVGRGLMSHDDLEAIHRYMGSELEKQGVQLGGVYYCPHDEEDGCECRKPKAGLFFRAARDHHIDLTKTVFIGDSQRDLEAGCNARCRTILLRPRENLLRVARSLAMSLPELDKTSVV